MPGPIPKRADDRIGHPHEAGSAKQIDKIEYTSDLKVPEANPDWTYIAKFSYQAFIDSPLKVYYTETDLVFGWMAAQAIHEAVSKPSPTKTLAAESFMRNGMFNEADRRRIRIELTRKEPEPNPVADKNVADFTARRQARQSG